MGASKKIAVCIVAGVLCAAAVAQTTTTGRTVRKLRVPVEEGAAAIAQAEAAIDKKDYAAAEKILKDATAAHPKDYRAWYDLGYVYTLTDRRPEAIAAYRQAVDAKPGIFESNLNLGLALAAAGDPQAATYLRAATTLKPQADAAEALYRAWFALGRVLTTGQPADALAAFSHAATLQPKLAEPHFYAGTLLEKQKNYAAAATELEKASALDPRNVEIAAALANVAMEGRDFARAESALRRYLELDPKSATAHLQLGRVLSAEGKNDAAAAAYQAAQQLAPNDPEVQREIAGVYYDAGKFAEAAAAYQALIAQSPPSAQLYYLLGRAQLRAKDFPAAQSTLLKAVQLKPDNADALGDLALAASENKQYGVTVKALELRARYAPETAPTWFLRATALDHLRDYKAASEAYRQFLATAGGKFPEQEWQAKHRLIAIDPKSRK
jgi:tetratricopeptide (TPR) repeat protein